MELYQIVDKMYPDHWRGLFIRAMMAKGFFPVLLNKKVVLKRSY